MKSKWLGFIKDMGDIIGGFVIGMSYVEEKVLGVIAGVVFIIVSLWLEYKNKNK